MEFIFYIIKQLTSRNRTLSLVIWCSAESACRMPSFNASANAGAVSETSLGRGCLEDHLQTFGKQERG